MYINSIYLFSHLISIFLPDLASIYALLLPINSGNFTATDCCRLQVTRRRRVIALETPRFQMFQRILAVFIGGWGDRIISVGGGDEARILL